MALKYIFDLDNVLYRDPVDKCDRYARAAARAAIGLGVNMEFETARLMAEQSFRDHRSEQTAFVEQFGFDPDEFTRHYHAAAVTEFAEAWEVHQGVTDAFNAIAPGDKVILTHSTSDWALPVLDALGMRGSIAETHILALDHPLVGFRRKNRDPGLFDDVLALLQVNGEDAVMFDDVHDNLLLPRSKGVATILVHWGAALQDVPAHVSDQVSDIEEYFLRKPLAGPTL